MSNRKMKGFTVILPLLLAGFLTLPGSIFAAHRLQDPQTPPDNTEKNLPTNHKDANRADQQSNTSNDVELTRKIRKALTDDKSLSTYAHNVKIITKNGVVHLKGPVRSQEEKDSVAAKATEIAGASNVKNDLTIKPAS